METIQHYLTFNEIIKEYKNLHYPGRIYTEAIKQDNFLETQFWCISSKQAKDEEQVNTEFGTVPTSLVPFKVKSLLDTGTFQDIIETKIENTPNLKLTDTAVFLEALNYYLENDDFQD